MKIPTYGQHFVCYFWFNGWTNINLGISLSLKPVNIEIHLPFGFIRLGWEFIYNKTCNWDEVSWQHFGTKQKFKEDYG